jgi:hypothetical protein
MAEIAEADAIADSSLLSEGITDRDRIALETYRDARAAMALIREAIEDCAPPGSVARESYPTPEFTAEAEALVRGIYAIAERCRSKRGWREIQAASTGHARQYGRGPRAPPCLVQGGPAPNRARGGVAPVGWDQSSSLRTPFFFRQRRVVLRMLRRSNPLLHAGCRFSCLPVVNLSNDADQQFFGDGIALYATR